MTRRFATAWSAIAAAAALALPAAACVVAFDSGPREPPIHGASDGAASEAAVGDGGVTGDADAAIDDAAIDGASYLAFDDAKNWEAHALGGGVYAGAAFDGRYVYFAPRGHLAFTRYDTQGGFDDPASWSSVALAADDAAASGFVGAAFHDGFVYLAPAGPSLVTIRYPVSAPFATASLQLFDLAPLVNEQDKNSGGYLGVAVFGGGLYFIPHGTNGVLARFDPAGDFTSEKSWSVAALSSSSDVGDFAGSVATSAGLYLVPSGRSIVLHQGNDIADAASFTAGPVLTGDFLGATTDGVTLYFAPVGVPVATTFGVGASLFSKAILPTFDLQAFAACGMDCFAGAVFDGRHVYFVPRNQARFVRFDTQSPQGFTDPLSWQIGQPQGGTLQSPNSFYGGAFDGRYVYYVPDGSGRVVRFHAREPAVLPASYTGSFL